MPPPPPTSVPFLQLTTCRLAASAPTSPQTSHTPLNSHTHVTMALGMHAQQQQHRLQARTANRRTAAAPLRPAQPANAAASRSRAQRGLRLRVMAQAPPFTGGTDTKPDGAVATATHSAAPAAAARSTRSPYGKAILLQGRVGWGGVG